MGRRAVPLVLALVVAAAAGVAATPGDPVRVVVLGDSYASGEGLASAEGACGRSAESSWSALTASGLGSRLARPTEVELLACSGAEVEDLTVGGTLGLEPQLSAVAAPADVALLTVGGNDLGFVDIVADCLGFADLRVAPSAAALPGGTWTDLVDGDGVDRGCEVTQDELLDRVATYDRADRFALTAEGDAGGLAELYATVVDRAVTEDGILVVVGYPSLFAESAAWPERYARRCHGLRARDAESLARVVIALDQQIAAEVARANALLGAARVVHVSVLAAFDGTDDGTDHRLCGGGTPWMNGLTLVEGGLDITGLLAQLGAGNGLDLEQLGARPGGSFHPNTPGHAGTAAVVLDAITPLLEDRP